MTNKQLGLFSTFEQSKARTTSRLRCRRRSGAIEGLSNDCGRLDTAESSRADPVAILYEKQIEKWRVQREEN